MEDLNLFNSVNYLFATPAYEGYYQYALDDLNSMSLIDKDSLKQLLLKLGCYNFIKVNDLLNCNFPIFYDVKKKELKEFEMNSYLTKDDLRNYILDELKDGLKQETKSSYEYYFGNDSNFYKNNFYNIMENDYGDSKSIQGSLSNRKYKMGK
jgi:hypothetical protein